MKPQLESGNGILITEDHAQTAHLLQRLLGAAFPHLHVHTAGSAEEALMLCRTRPPQVVVMDISLPGINGIEATRQIKATTPAVHVVIHSNLDAEIYTDACLQAGASAYVLKANTQGGLITAVTQLLSAQASS